MTQIYDNYLDIVVQPGCDFDFYFGVTPIAISGTAVMVIDGIGSFAVTCTNSVIGVNPYLNFSLSVPGATTAAWVYGTYDYRVIVTLEDGSVDELVVGIVMVKQLSVIS